MIYNSVVQGWYHTSFFHINLRFKWNMEFDTLSDSARGLIVHEYVHFLQNLTTPWGLWSGMVDYASYAEIGAYVQPLAKAGKDITFKDFDWSDQIKRMFSSRESGMGTHGAGASCEYIQSVTPIKTGENRPVYEIEGYDLTATGAKVFKRGAVELGAFAIKEGMAYMCQQMADPEAKGTAPAYPYGIVQLIADQYYPKTANNLPILVACCYLALFSLSPGKRFIDLLNDANRTPEVEISTFVEDHITNDKVTLRNAAGVEKLYTPIELCQLAVDRFLQALNALPGVTTQYIEEVLNRTKLADGIIPLLAPFSNGTVTNDDLRTIMEYLGAPMITNDALICHYPMVNGQPSQEIMMLWSYLQLMTIFVNPTSGCPIRPECDLCAGDPTCASPTPWQHRGFCALTPAARAFSLLQ